ncbi:hypothetical protein L3X38_023384 [Prunus dulcis]|uniref:Uncharacterized protein n=1 Tax=Prunus dulcis TaxID=3755 RepID=A0AAD4VXQ4_PRUDU|nr:hypothetical protein L3X38_023384 [Prunus dulcis]
MEEEEGLKENVEAKEVEKEVMEEKRACMVDGSSLQSNYIMGSLTSLPKDYQDTPTVNRPSGNPGEEDGKGGPDDRLVGIRNIFTLCGNYRELSQHVTTPAPTVASVKSETDRRDTEVYVKWEASKENPGKFITTLKVVKDASLANLRKLIAIYLGADNQAFTFLTLGDPTGASVPKEKEATIQATKLPLCNNKSNGYLASLRPLKGMQSPITKHTVSLKDFIPQIQNGVVSFWYYQKENQGAVVIFFTRTASQAASVAAARDFPVRGGAAAPPCSLIGPPVTDLVCSNGNQGQLVFCKRHGTAIKERSFKSLPGWLKRVVFLPLITMLSQKHNISRYG